MDLGMIVWKIVYTSAPNPTVLSKVVWRGFTRKLTQNALCTLG